MVWLCFPGSGRYRRVTPFNVRGESMSGQSAHIFNARAMRLLDEARVQILTPENEAMNASAAVRSSVSAVEAFLNEIAQVGRGYEKHGHSSKNPLVRASQELIRAEKAKRQLMPKLLTAIEALSGEVLQVGSVRCLQQLRLVIEVRNELVHPKATELELSIKGLEQSKEVTKIIRGLETHGIKPRGGEQDWSELVMARDFAYWAYLVCLEAIEMVIDRFPYQDTIVSWKQLYCVDRKTLASWPNYRRK